MTPASPDSRYCALSSELHAFIKASRYIAGEGAHPLGRYIEVLFTLGVRQELFNQAINQLIKFGKVD